MVAPGLVLTGRRRPRKGRPWLWALAVLAVVVAVGAVLDAVAAAVACSRLADQVRSSAVAQSATASIDSFPFLGRLLVNGDVGRVVVIARGVPAGDLVLDSVTVDARRVRVDRHSLLPSLRPVVESIASADVTIRVTPQQLSAAVGHPVSLSSDNRLDVQLGGVDVPVTLAVGAGDVLTATAGGVRLLAVDLAEAPVVPRCGLAISDSAGLLMLSCHVAPVPASVISALSHSA